MNLNELDFKNGIMSEYINQNFKMLDQAIKEERLSIAGYGISYGLEASITDLSVSFNSGHVIDKSGSSFFITPTSLVFDYPETESITEEKEVLFDGAIFLSHIPYATDGKSETNLAKILIKINNTSIDIISIEENKIIVNKKYANSKATIQYFYALNRIDQVIIEDDILKINKGISSNSFNIPSEQNLFCIGCFKINPYGYKNNEDIYIARAEQEEQVTHLRNIYTNSNNELFMNGLNVNKLGFIYFSKPEKPQPNMLWYDFMTNKLYAYLYNEWTALQNQGQIPVNESKLYTPENFPIDLATFIFHKTNDLNMRFIPGKKALSININQYNLFRDQFKEISYSDALKDEKLKTLLPLYGYTINEDFADDYENVGIGFQLTQPLINKVYLEVSVTHFINDASINTRYQRSATFIRNGYVELEPDQTEIITELPFRFGENQIELKTTDKNLFNRFDYDEVGKVQGELTNKVVLKNSFGYNERVHYKITTNIYSYDHIAKLLESAGE